MTNFEWLCRDYPDYVKDLMCGETEECFAKLDPNVPCVCSNCDETWNANRPTYCKEMFKKWLDEKCE